MIAGLFKQGVSLLGVNRAISEERLYAEARTLLKASIQQVQGKVLEPWEMLGVDFLDEEVVEAFLALAAQRGSGTPLQYLTGWQGFYHHDYAVRSGVLIPRPETEQLLEQSLAWVRERFSSGWGLEIGLGSGVLSIELLALFPQLRMQASEFSEVASICAQENAQRILGDTSQRLRCVRPSSLKEVWAPFEDRLEKADFLISNPPYLNRLFQEQEAEPEVLNYEPSEALFPEHEDCLFFYRSIAERVLEFLRPDGMIFLEIAHERADETCKLFEAWKTQIFCDLNRRRRVLVVELSHG
jgi:release factor glutamine methyltransferase